MRKLILILSGVVATGTLVGPALLQAPPPPPRLGHNRP